VRFLKTLLLGIFIGCVIGLWFGVNIGQGNDLLSNPIPAAEEAA